MVPAGNDAVQIFADDGFVRRFDDRRQLGCDQFGVLAALLFFRRVEGEGNGAANGHYQADFVFQEITLLAGKEDDRANDGSLHSEWKGADREHAALQVGLAPGDHSIGGCDVVANIVNPGAQRRSQSAHT